MKDSVTWRIGGEAGFGIMSSGTMLAKTFSRQGYSTLGTNEYPSLIRGGHNIVTLRLAVKKFHSLTNDIHILVALNKETVDIHKNELLDGGIVVYDPADFEWKPEHFEKKIHLVAIPLREMVRQKSADPVMRNTILLGATVALLGGEFSQLETVISDQFSKKGEKVVLYNVDLAKLGFDHVKQEASACTDCYLAPAISHEEQMIVNASEALGLGAVRAGMKFAAIYPMTPINSVITFLADHAKELGIVYKQPEDEIAGMNMAIGASYAGVRSMVATSGGGFALMVEGLSLAGIQEIPIVIDLGMRVGPATGMPTWTETGELRFAIHSGHGEFPRIVLAPGTCEECYTMTIDAFNLADKYQVPVFVLTDKYLNESQWCVSKAVFEQPVTIDRGKVVEEKDLVPGHSFKRYELDVADGVSPRSFPGMKGGQYFNNSYEHDEVGLVTEDPEMRIKMADKRLKKFDAMNADIIGPKVYGDSDAELTFVTWGSSTGPVLEAMDMLKQKGTSVRTVQYGWMYPFPTEQSIKILDGSKRMILVEQNSMGQLGGLIREFTGIDITERILKYSGRPLYPEEIVSKV